MAGDAAERYLQQRQKERAAIRARLAEARAASTQEKFDFQTFAGLYDVRGDLGSGPITPEVLDRYEEEYYLGPIRAGTIREFAARKEELKLHDAT